MSVRYIEWAFRQNLKSPMQKLVLVKISDNADDSGLAFPSIDHIAKFTCASDSSVKRAIKEIEAKGLMTIKKMPAAKNHKRNEYQLHYTVELHYEIQADESEGSSVTVTEFKCQSDLSQVSERPTNRQLTVNEPSVNICIDQMFESFWFAGMKKVGKKASLNQFKTAMKKHGKDDPQAFTDLLVNDVKTRVAMNQFGFDKLHPERYLKNERWTDEVSRNETNQNTNQQRPLSAVERVAAANGFGQQANQPDETGYSGAVVIDGEYVRS